MDNNYDAQPTAPMAPASGADPWASVVGDKATVALSQTMLRAPSRHASLAPVSPAPEPGALPSPMADFELLAVIGRGGMGEIWEARQVALDRRVAVKRVLPRLLEGEPSESRASMLAQFESEALITARLEHPGIVPVHDLGFDAQGVPMLAMKLVHGRTWAQLLREDHASKSETEVLSTHLPILMSVAQSVAFAHHRGVIHRDLKPSQVMLGEFGEVLLMDWGLAILLEDAPNEQTPRPLPYRNMASNPVGTPVFMAPEQTERSTRRLGTHTDVFLLGGILYYILTGEAPHEGYSPALVMAEAASCRVQPPELRARERYIPAELSALCMAAMRKEPGERIGSALEFARAIREYLAGEGNKNESRRLAGEVERALGTAAQSYDRHNRTQSQLEEAARLWPQNPALAALRDRAALAYTEFALAQRDLGIARIQAERIAEPERRSAMLGAIDRRQQALAQQRRRMRFAIGGAMTFLGALVVSATTFAVVLQNRNETIRAERDAAERERRIAMAQAKSGGDLVNFMLGDLRQSLNLERAADRAVASRIGAGVSDYYRSLDTKEFSPELLLGHAAQLQNVGGRFLELGLAERAKELLRVSLDIRQRILGETHPAAAQSMASISRALALEGNYESAEDLARAALALQERATVQDELATADAADALAMVLNVRGKYAEAREQYERAFAIRGGRLGVADPQSVSTVTSLAGVLQQIGEFDAARGLFEDTIAAFGEAPAAEPGLFGMVLTAYASMETTLGRWADSESLLLRARELVQRGRGTEHPDYAMVLNHLGALYLRWNKPAEAEPFLLEALAIRERVLDANHMDLAVSHNNLASLYNDTQRFELARASYERCLEIYRKALGDDHDLTAAALGNLGNFLSMQGDPIRARELISRAIEIKERIHGTDSPNVAVYYNNLGTIEFRQGALDRAEPLLRRALEIHERAYGVAHPETARGYNNLAVLYSRLERWPEALEMIGKSVDSYTATFGANDRTTLGIRGKVGPLLLKSGRAQEAERAFRDVEAAWKEVDGERAPGRLEALAGLYRALVAQQRQDEAQAILAQLRALDYADEGFWRTAAGS